MREAKHDRGGLAGRDGSVSHNDTAITLIQRGEGIQIASESDYLAAAEYLKGATALTRSIQEHYKPLKLSADQLHDQLVSAERSQLLPIQSVIERVKGLMLGWQSIQQQLAAKKQAELQAKADQRGGPMVPQMQVQTSVPSIGGISGRSTWSAIVDDQDKIPREYMIPDMKALNAAAKRMKDKFNIPGARAVEDRNVVVKGV